MALQRLTPADIEALASDTNPLLSSLPHPPRHTLSTPPPRPSRRAPRQRAQDRPQPVSRRMRRYHNDMRLAINAYESGVLPTTAAEHRSLFERSSTSTWSALHQDEHARRTWQNFVDLPDDQQTHLLQHTTTPRFNASPNKTLKLLIKQRGPVVTHLVRTVEDTVVQLPKGGVVHFTMPQPWTRMVAHHVAQFHSMSHRSVDIGSQRITVIHAINPVRSGPRLVDVLAT